MNNSISITRQNVTLASAQRALAGNSQGNFAVVAFRVDTEDNVKAELPTATGLTIVFDPDLTVMGDDEQWWFLQRVYTPEGRTLYGRAHGANEQVKFNDNKFFCATSDSDSDFVENGYYLYYACVQFPSDVAVGDEFDITIKTSGTEENYDGEVFPVEFKCVNSDLDATDRAAQDTWTKAHIMQGKITIVE